MKKYYFAAFVPEEENGYSVYFPDIEGCYTSGETLEDAMFMAEDVLALVLQDMAANRRTIPAPSTLEKVKKAVIARRAEDDLPTSEETVYQMVPAPSLDMVPVKVTISLPKAYLQELDSKAKIAGFTRSGLIAHLAQNFTPAHV